VRASGVASAVVVIGLAVACGAGSSPGTLASHPTTTVESPSPTPPPLSPIPDGTYDNGHGTRMVLQRGHWSHDSENFGYYYGTGHDIVFVWTSVNAPYQIYSTWTFDGRLLRFVVSRNVGGDAADLADDRNVWQSRPWRKLS
jgi:hypothetical protein